MKVAVLGASGFIGGHTLRGLRAAGHQVRPVVRNPRFFSSDPERRLADVCDVYALRDALTGCEAVVHAALGPTDVILGLLAPVYAAAEAVGVRRLVYLSSGSVHGQSPADGTDERSPLTLQHAFAYNAAKVRAERKLRRLRARGTVELVLLRPTIVFGPGSRWTFDFADALRSRTAYVVDGAGGICNSIYVDNLIHAIDLALVAPGADGEAFLVADEETVTWRDLYRPVAAALGVDFGAVPSLAPPDLSLSFKQRYVEPVRSSEAAHYVISRFPRGAKDALKGVYRFARGSNPHRARAAESAPPAAVVSETPKELVASPEIAALHTCRWRLPHDKARRLLGYTAPVSFEEGCHRSLEWLLFERASQA